MIPTSGLREDSESPSPVGKVVEAAVGVGNRPGSALLAVLGYSFTDTFVQLTAGHDVHEDPSTPNLQMTAVPLKGDPGLHILAGIKITGTESFSGSEEPSLNRSPSWRVPRIITHVRQQRPGLGSFAPNDSSEGVHSAHGRSVVVGV